MTYKSIVADPPWQYDNVLDMSDGINRSAMSQYATLDLDQVKSFTRTEPVSSIHTTRQPYGVGCNVLGDTFAEDSLLWLWVTNPFLLDGSAIEVAKAWGYTPKQIVTWVKGRLSIDQSHPDYDEAKLVLQIGMGRHLRGCTEHLLLCTRGRTMAMIQDKGVPNFFVAPRGAHSEKPDEAYALIQRAIGDVPSLDIFARKRRPGYDAIGDEL